MWLRFTIGEYTWTIDKVQVDVVSDLNKQDKRTRCFVSGAEASPCILGDKETLTVRFNVKRASRQMRPHQAMLLVGYPEIELENAHVIPVNTRGEAVLTLKHEDIPLQLLFGNSPLLLTIVIGSFDTAKPLLHTLGPLQIIDIDEKFDPPKPLLQYGPLPEIEHIFSPEQKSSPKIIVIIFSVAILFAFGQLCKTNASRARLAQTSVPATKLNLGVCLGLYAHGWIAYIKRGSFFGPDSVYTPATRENISTRRLWVGLKYNEMMPVLRRLVAISKPSRKRWMSPEALAALALRRVSAVPALLPGECLFVQTDKGVLEAREAAERLLGGMLLCRSADGCTAVRMAEEQTYINPSVFQHVELPSGTQYQWMQTLGEVEVRLGVPYGTRGRDLSVLFEKKKIKVCLQQKEVLLEGELSREIKVEESAWTLGKRPLDGAFLYSASELVLHLEKINKMEWWSSVIQGHPSIDTSKIQPENSKLGDLDAETRSMFDQRQKELGKPTSDELKKQEILKKFQAQHPELDFSKAKIG
ncbi:hypothetical protein PMAC_001768 [Pneumocystis sp. 'macacae']|nr:hypothetical protein PMAC_001768 [Pneumocystis sp. 'macacae']